MSSSFLLPRRDFLAVGASALVARHLRWPAGAARPVPSVDQLQWHRDELALFAHFGVNTFTDREWGDGKESPSIFNPTAFDARQWTRTAKAAGFKMVILTAKHHDGFCLWPTATTAHSVKSSPFRGGSGDVVREVADACRADGLRLGLYLSPWDRNAAVYGSDGYHDFYLTQLRELLTRYGRVDEVWFDGANGEGPNGKKQIYDWPRYWGEVKRLQPQAVIFSDAGPDIRWIGNEAGTAGETNWSMVDPRVVSAPGVSGEGVTRMLQQGDPNGSVWRPGETDTSIRPGWFYHAADDAKVRSVDNLVDIYVTSVGRNSKLLLNVPPTRDGLLHDVDVARLAGMRRALDARFGAPIATSRQTQLSAMSGATGELRLELPRPRRVAFVTLQERIAAGQHVAAWRIEGQGANGAWTALARGTTIGHKRIVAVPAAEQAAVRVVIEQALAPVDGLSMVLHAEA
ncbi:MAG: alpha-L-fucosidase [Gemmatimonadetes bacterium]|nr:alpha-L-fucosidase [Gemmatimonadota bacterium]